MGWYKERVVQESVKEKCIYTIDTVISIYRINLEKKLDLASDLKVL